MRLLLSSLLASAILPAAAQAQQAPADGSPHSMVALGAAVVPEYDGADTMRVLPFALGEVRWGGVDFQLRGQGLRIDLVSDPRLAIGPVIGARLPRNNVDGRVGLLPEIDTAVEAGGFVGYRIGGDRTGQGSVQVELSVVHDVTRTHNGLLATASAGYAAIRQPKGFLSLDVQTTWANRDYTRTYFGVDPADAARSGLRVYRPGSGFRDVGAGLTGRRWQPAAGIGMSYRF
jgi:MipA family protein